jgi:hypothetical protein
MMDAGARIYEVSARVLHSQYTAKEPCLRQRIRMRFFGRGRFSFSASKAHRHRGCRRPHPPHPGGASASVGPGRCYWVRSDACVLSDVWVRTYACVYAPRCTPLRGKTGELGSASTGRIGRPELTTTPSMVSRPVSAAGRRGLFRLLVPGSLPSCSAAHAAEQTVSPHTT